LSRVSRSRTLGRPLSPEELVFTKRRLLDAGAIGAKKREISCLHSPSLSPTFGQVLSSTMNRPWGRGGNLHVTSTPGRRADALCLGLFSAALQGQKPLPVRHSSTTCVQPRRALQKLRIFSQLPFSCASFRPYCGLFFWSLPTCLVAWANHLAFSTMLPRRPLIIASSSSFSFFGTLNLSIEAAMSFMFACHSLSVMASPACAVFISLPM